MEDNDFDIFKMSETDEGKALAAKLEDVDRPDDDFDEYLTDKCGIETPEDDDETTDTIPVDITIPDVTTGDPIVDLGEGEDAINQFLDFYELGTSTTLTDEERSCIVSSLVDEVTGDELNEAISGNPSPEVQQALGLAFINCEVDVAG